MTTIDRKEYINRAIDIHGKKYNYKKIPVGVRAREFVTITCPEHGDFSQRLHSHLQGHGCKQCAVDLHKCAVSHSPKALRDKFVRDARLVHGDQYDYSKVSYVGKQARDKVTIVCPKLGEFEQTYGNHVTLGHKHPQHYFTIGKIEKEEKTYGTLKERLNNFLRASEKIHNHEYTYPFIRKEFKGLTSEITVVCPKCGPIKQMAHNHMKGHGCRLCKRSALEKGLAHWLEKTLPPNTEIIYNDRSIIGKEIDVYIPSYKLAIEIGSVYFHGDHMVENNYHAEKQKQCSQLGIQLITIFDIEWNETKKRRIIKSSIKAKLGLLSKRIAARKTVVQEVPGKEAKDFLVKNHLQSHSSATVNLGLYHNTELVSLLTMGRPRFDSKYEWEIIRFCSAVNTNVMGAFGKLMSFFHKQYHPNSIVTYANLRWGDGKLYENSGFTFVRRSSPSPWYCPSNKSMGKFYHRMRVQKYRLHEILKDFDPELTARENLKNHHFVAVYDCGTNVYKWEKPQNK